MQGAQRTAGVVGLYRFVGEGRRANSDGPITGLPLRLRAKRLFFFADRILQLLSQDVAVSRGRMTSTLSNREESLL